jgi:uncharacterized protein (DUF302 family)
MSYYFSKITDASFEEVLTKVADEVLLPCNIIVQELPNGMVEVAAIDPVQSMQAVGNPKLKVVAEQVQAKLRNVIHSV